MAIVGLVLLIASGNVAMLLSVRNAAREREFALRRALGANATVVFGQLISESLLLVAAGFRSWLDLRCISDADVHQMVGARSAIVPDRHVLLFTLTSSAVVALVFGLVPMRVASSVPLASTLQSSVGSSNTDRRHFGGRHLVLALQISLGVILLFAAALLYGTLRNLESRDLGTAGLLVFGISPQADIRTNAEAIRLHLKLLERLRALPWGRFRNCFGGSRGLRREQQRWCVGRRAESASL